MRRNPQYNYDFPSCFSVFYSGVNGEMLFLSPTAYQAAVRTMAYPTGLRLPFDTVDKHSRYVASLVAVGRVRLRNRPHTLYA